MPVKDYLIRNYKDKTIGKEITPHVQSGLKILGEGYQDTMWKARRGMLGPHLFVGSHGIDTIGKIIPDIPIDKGISHGLHNWLGIDKPLANVGGEAGEMLLTRKALKSIPNLVSTKVTPYTKGLNPVPVKKPPINVTPKSQIIEDAFLPQNSLAKRQIKDFTSGSLKPGGLFDPNRVNPNLMFATSPGQSSLFPEPIDPEGKEAFRIYTESLAKRSGYDTFKMMKKEIFDKWPQKERDQVFRQLWEGTQTGYVGYSEHLTAKASKKLRRETIAKKNPTFSPKQIDAKLAEKSKNTFDLDWNWDKDWIDEKGIRRTDGLDKGDRNAPENMSVLFNDRLKSVKDQLENVGYGSEERVGILWGDPATNKFRDPDKRFLIKFEDPAKRSIKQPYRRQNPGDAIVYRASNGKMVGKLGQYLDVLYPKKVKHPQTGLIDNSAFERMQTGVLKTVNPNTGKLFTNVEEFREFIFNERFQLILDGTKDLPSNMTKRNRYIDEFVRQDMVDLREKYPWLPEVPAIKKQIEEDPGMSSEALDKRTQTRKGPFQMTKTEQFNPRQILLDVFGPDPEPDD